ncbi:MAG: FeoB-associated Cys-rich membrane protein [Chloroflexi bacterium]|nr:FeoB-associated Cys-rich membrane protein [Chloroflexota bacterium]MCL5105384.1 FeoB-associated Cys-rich membrane protein [Armatimonadota bacterium]
MSAIIQWIIVAVIVIAATIYLIRKLRREASGECDGCCEGCKLHEDCRDASVAESRKREETIPWEDVKSRLGMKDDKGV